MAAPPPTNEAARPAAQYIRMSKEHQRYSPMHQRATIAAYAAANGFEIVRTYIDEGVSGVSIRNRLGLQSLLSDVLAGEAGYRTVLVFDVSRWGRFQNPDQSAHYEFLCTEAGVRVEYCAELFDNDGSLSSTVLKSLKRAMAAEYSRDLSAKIRADQARLAALGFWQGGGAPFGLRRRIVFPDGRLGAILQTGERKAIQSHHIILVPGPRRDVTTVNRIFRLYAFGGLGVTRIARLLNREGASATPWTDSSVNSILINAAYVGDLEYAKTRGELGPPQRRQPRSEWTVVKHAFEAIVPRRVFEAAQAVRAARHPKPSSDEILVLMRRIYARHGMVTFKLIRAEAAKGVVYYIKQHGGLRLACAAIGARLIDRPKAHRCRLDDATALDRLAALFARHGYLSNGLIRQDPSTPSATTYRKRWGSLAQAYAQVDFHPIRDAQRPLPNAPSHALSAAVRQAKGRRRISDPSPDSPAPQAPQPSSKSKRSDERQKPGFYDLSQAIDGKTTPTPR
jgi:DNA invertase Pin-like site-specific DNA recombinase